MHKALLINPGYTLTQYLVPHPFSGTWNQTLSFKGDLKAGRHAGSLSLRISKSSSGVVLSARISKSMYPSWVHTAAVREVHINWHASHWQLSLPKAVMSWLEMPFPVKDWFKNKPCWRITIWPAWATSIAEGGHLPIGACWSQGHSGCITIVTVSPWKWKASSKEDM